MSETAIVKKKYEKTDRVVVQGDGPWQLPPNHPAYQQAKCVKVPGTVTWEEHERAWREYARRYGRGQSAERLVERGGFSWSELTMFLGHEPKTWEPRGEAHSQEWESQPNEPRGGT